MAYRWVAEPAPGSESGADDLEGLGIDQAFADQTAAERWLSETWAEMADLGVTTVSLFEEDRLVYGPMSLSAG
ncbi:MULTISPECIES: hypothetical protein [Aestuariimicrobium]|uniref:hypothetical protein n=1 Tax=Aestuariimicrobium TaxID=396388 RepID=UPI0003B56E7E|nr:MULTISPECIES: hypothetical protein [Aestuariimicrobium]CAI9399791.1 hypothetical protein AESSP_00263 [Aestuariimicrobium sp. T2.26MG-19.2B]